MHRVGRAGSRSTSDESGRRVASSFKHAPSVSSRRAEYEPCVDPCVKKERRRGMHAEVREQ